MNATVKRFVSLMLVVLLVLAPACSPAAAPSPAPSTPTTPSAPLAPVASSASPTPAALPAPTEQSVQVDALYYSQGPDGATGGTSPVTIRVRPAAESGELRVGFFEEEVQGTGGQWQSSGWIAVLLGSMLVGANPADYEFSFSVGGRVDGPSAGCLMTVGVLAALRGDTVKPDATMTGTINPDGTIGPVGGIPHKIEGAAKAGKTLVLVPVGQRYDFDMNRGESVDLIAVGREVGVEVREVSTVFEAYEALTGQSLPRPTGSSASPQLPPQAFDRMRAKALEWVSRYQKERNEFNNFAVELQELAADSVLEADQRIQESDRAMSQGLVAVAYGRASEAAATMQTVNLLLNSVEQYLTNGIAGAVNDLQASMSVQTELDAVVAALQAESPRTASDMLALFDAYSDIGYAEGLRLVADGNVADLVQNADFYTEDEIFGQLAIASLEYGLAGVYLQYARDAVDIGMGFGVSPAPDAENVVQIAETMRRAAEANMALFDSIIVDEYARQTGMHTDVIRQVLMGSEMSYLLATAAQQGIGALRDQVGTGPSGAALVFGHSQSAFSLSAALLAKYYSLGAQTDENLDVVSFEREKALGEMLDFADQRARELIAVSGEDVPVPAIYYYELGRSYRQGSAQDQLDALGYYWQAAILAQAEQYLVGK